MRTLLILGSKPDPCIPPASSYDDVACSNASGFSADRHGMPVPAFTVMTSFLTSGIASGKQSLRVISGLRTRTVYLIPRQEKSRSFTKFVKKIKRLPVTIKMTPLFFRWKLRQAGFGWDKFVSRNLDYYFGMIEELCRHDRQITAQIAVKKPSTGLMALVIGMSQGTYDRYILSGFSFELTHAYGENPEIRERGGVSSVHANTDILLLQRLAAVHGNIYTTEPKVHELAGIPLLPGT